MKTAIALGTFDGLHAGHRAVLEEIKGFNNIAVTFDIPPKAVLTGEAKLLILPEDRRQRLNSLGIDRVVMQRFADVKDISAEDYLMTLKNNYNPSRIVCGFNYRFGKGALGDTELLSRFCRQNSIELVVVPPIEINGKAISSTAIRNMISNGEIKGAVDCIYGGFKFSSPVLHGDARGRTLGFPTANQLYPQELVVPKLGVYLSQIEIDGKKYSAITNIGFRPTFKTNKIGCETYIKNFEGDIYGKTITTSFLRFIRPEQKFSSADELKKSVLNDIKLLD